MDEPQYSIRRTAAQIRSVAHRFAYAGLVASAFALMLVGKADTIVVERLRAHVTDAVAPILDALSRPIAGIADIVARVQEVVRLRDENFRLHEENERLRQWQAVVQRLETENESLRSLLNFTPELGASFVTGRVIADTGGAFAHSLVLGAGTGEGVKKGSAVVTGEGLVGRIAAAGYRSARVLLITDLNSRIPVIVEPSGIRAILAGDNTERPKLTYLPPAATVSPGDRVVTSGHGGALPARIAVGVVVSVSDSGIRVRPHVERHRLEYVRVVDYGLGGILWLPQSPTGAEAPLTREGTVAR